MAFVAQGSRDLANERLSAASRTYQAARKEWIAAGTEVTRLHLLEFASRHPGINAFCVTLEWDEEYDGGLSVRLTAQVDESVPGQRQSIEEYGDPDDELYDWDTSSEEAGLLLHKAGLSRYEYPTDGEYVVTVEKLRELEF